MRILSVVGTRPQLIKAAALSPVLRARHDEILVDTGQHYDDALAGTFYRELGLPAPDHGLGVGGGTHAEQTAAMLTGLESILEIHRPDAVLVYGDTNSTLAGALVAAKAGVPLAHVEAGLRSFDRRMPEEINRVVADHLARWLFAPTPTAVANLRDEGITRGVVLVGDLMQDLAARVGREVATDRALAAASRWLAGGTQGATLSPGGYLFATVHRAENRQPAALRAWTGLLERVARPDRPVILAIHPGTRLALEREGVALAPDVRLVEPQGYRTSLTLQMHAAAVVTDSGGVQREAAWLGAPCLVLRETTEWLEAVDDSAGRMVIVGHDGDLAERVLAELAPPDGAAALARDRAARFDLAPAGAADAIAATLEAAE
ncbi:MAG: UDP-N-acetylglucosamine 2-epimerase (non-hydrolyzing) [Chloroflexi bacterium]|nr:UDP-N-acetylglucosamine 2-epimerase (non-hydrolyzing) [Chloroflexota bacterium]